MDWLWLLVAGDHFRSLPDTCHSATAGRQRRTYGGGTAVAVHFKFDRKNRIVTPTFAAQTWCDTNVRGVECELSSSRSEQVAVCSPGWAFRRGADATKCGEASGREVGDF